MKKLAMVVKGLAVLAVGTVGGYMIGELIRFIF